MDLDVAAGGDHEEEGEEDEVEEAVYTYQLGQGLK
jgi:hypothetical protein